MNFILISKKESFNEQINEDLLILPDAPSLISREAIKFEISNFILYLYPYDHIDKEVHGYSYYAGEDKILLCNGLVNVNDELRNLDICKFFEELNDSDDLFGDYQLISIDKNGNGFLKTPSLSIKQLFFYEDENCTVLSTEIKLIVDGIEKFREKMFVDNFDIDFIDDSIFREWKEREIPQNTIFKEIKRIFPHDIKYFENGKIIIERKDAIEVPQWFRKTFNEDRTKLYDDYYESLIKFAEVNLLNLKPNIKKIVLGLTGGLDSRLSASILTKICKKHAIPFECNTGGLDNHPDVIIAKKVAKALDVEHLHFIPQGNIRPNTVDYNNYEYTFYMAQGDWNSKDFVPIYSRKILYPDRIQQLGMDAFKRVSIDKLLSANRWFARRILFHKNFFLPLFFTEYEMWFALLYAEKKDKEYYKEFVYEILKRAAPESLYIAFAGDSLPQINVEPYLTKFDTIFHEKEPFLWDYNYVFNNLKPVLKKKFDELDKENQSLLKFTSINELDYFFNKEIGKIIDLYNKKQIDLEECFKRLLNERFSKKYPRTKIMVPMTKEARLNPYISKMQILMDFASVADKKSFREIEKDIEPKLKI